MKRAFAGVLILLLLFGICTPAFAKDTKPTFTDVYTIDWYAKDVGYVYNESLMRGYCCFPWAFSPAALNPGDSLMFMSKLN